MPTALLGRDAAVAVDFTVPDGAGGAVKGGMGDRAREFVDFVDVTVPADFASPAEVDGLGGGLSNLLAEPEAFRVLVAAAASVVVFAF